MKVLASLAGGLAGAITVTLLHETLRKVDDSAPRLDLVGERATQKLAEKAGYSAPTGKSLYVSSILGSILTNTLTYSLAGINNKRPLSIGTLMGAAMGYGAVKMPNKLGLNGHHVANEKKKKWLTIGLYIVGGLIASAVAHKLDERKKKKIVSPYKAPNEAKRPVLDITV